MKWLFCYFSWYPILSLSVFCPLLYFVAFVHEREKKITAIQGENVSAAWDDFSALQLTPFHCKVQRSYDKKPLQWLIRCSHTGRKQRREEPTAWTKTIFWNIIDRCTNRRAFVLQRDGLFWRELPTWVESGGQWPYYLQHTAEQRGEVTKKNEKSVRTWRYKVRILRIYRMWKVFLSGVGGLVRESQMLYIRQQGPHHQWIYRQG